VWANEKCWRYLIHKTNFLSANLIFYYGEPLANFFVQVAKTGMDQRRRSPVFWFDKHDEVPGRFAANSTNNRRLTYILLIFVKRLQKRVIKESDAKALKNILGINFAQAACFLYRLRNNNQHIDGAFCRREQPFCKSMIHATVC